MLELTLEALITRVQTALYQAAGPSVQLYSESMIAQMIEDAFVTLANDPKIKWKKFRIFNRYTLDGTTGRVTVPLNTTFKAFGDIYNIFPDNSKRPLTYLATSDNPYMITGSRPLKYIRDTADTIRVIPATATGDIIVVGKSVPQPPLVLTDNVQFDYIAIMNYVCWEWATDDGANPGMAEKFRIKFEDRMDLIKAEEATEAIQLTGGQSDIPDQWYTTGVGVG